MLLLSTGLTWGTFCSKEAILTRGRMTTVPDIWLGSRLVMRSWSAMMEAYSVPWAPETRARSAPGVAPGTITTGICVPAAHPLVRLRIDLRCSGLLPGWDWPDGIANRFASNPHAARRHGDFTLLNHAGGSCGQASHADHRGLTDGRGRFGIRVNEKFLLASRCRDDWSHKPERQ